VIYCQEWGYTRLLVGKLGHTGLVPFVDELDTVCWKVPLEYYDGFEVTFQVSHSLFIGFSPDWEGTTRLWYTDVLVVREIECGS